MAVFPDRIVLKNSTDDEASIIAAIQTGGADEITQGEIVLGISPTSARIYTKASNGSIAILNGVPGGILGDLADVDLSTPATDGQVLTWVDSNSRWESANTGGATTLDELSDVDTSTTAPTDGQVLAWVDANNQWEPADASGGGGAVDSVNGKTGVVSLGIQDMDDYEPNSLPSGARYALGGGQFPGSGLWYRNSNRISWGAIDADSVDRTSEITAASGSIFWSTDGSTWTEIFFTGSPQTVGDSYYIDITSGDLPALTGDLYLSFSTPGTPSPAPLEDGDLLQWSSTDQKFRPEPAPDAAATRALLGIGEYADDAAAGTGGVASGAMYYNTTSTDYRLKT